MCAECPSLWMKARLQLTFFCYKPFCFCFFIFLHDLHTKSRKVCQKTRSALPQASVPCKGQCTKHTTAKRPFVARIHHFYIDHNAPCLLHKSFVKQWWISSGDVSGTRLLSGVTLAWIGHFRVPKTLTFKMRLGAQPFLWKWVLFAMSTYPRFETEARGNSDVAYWQGSTYNTRFIKALLELFKTCHIVYC